MIAQPLRIDDAFVFKNVGSDDEESTDNSRSS